MERTTCERWHPAGASTQEANDARKLEKPPRPQRPTTAPTPATSNKCNIVLAGWVFGSELSPMISLDTLTDQTLGMRQMTVKLLKGIPIEHADTIPPTWKNNARWHAGHLLVTPYLITYGIMNEPLPVPDDYRKWFAKGSSPDKWTDSDDIPSFSDLVDDIVPASGRLFDALKDRINEPFIEPYATSVGILLKTPAESLNFSMAHDGIHLGLLLALNRALQVSH